MNANDKAAAMLDRPHDCDGDDCSTCYWLMIEALCELVMDGGTFY